LSLGRGVHTVDGEVIGVRIGVAASAQLFARVRVHGDSIGTKEAMKMTPVLARNHNGVDVLPHQESRIDNRVGLSRAGYGKQSAERRNELHHV